MKSEAHPLSPAQTGGVSAAMQPEALLQAIGLAIIATDLEGCIGFWNRAAEELYGWRAAQVLGRDIVEIIPAEIAREEAVQIMEHLRQGERWVGKFAARRRDGSQFLALVTDAPLLDSEGRLCGIVGISTDASRFAELEGDWRERVGRLLEEMPAEFQAFARSLPALVEDLHVHQVELRARNQELERVRAELEQVRNSLEQTVAARTAELCKANIELQRRIEREQVLQQVRDCLLSLVERQDVPPAPWWVERLGEMGLAVDGFSLEVPSTRPGCFHTVALGDFFQPGEKPLFQHGDFPWVHQAWESGRPVQVERERLVELGYGHWEMRCLVEIPLVQGGSLGFNSKRVDRFDEADMQVLEQVSSLLGEAMARWRAMARVQQTSQRLRVILQSIGEGILTTDQKGRVEMLNRVAEAWTGWREEEARGRPLEEVFALFDRKLNKPLPSLALQVLGRGEEGMLEVEVGLRHRGGLTRTIACTVSTIHNGQGIHSGAVLSFRDLEERLRLEEQMVQAGRLQALGEMAAGVAHELGQPLAGIRSFAEGLVYHLKKGRLDEEKVFADLGRIVEQVERMGGIIDHMRLFSREPGEREPELFCPAQTVGAALALTGRLLQAQGIRLVVEVEKGLPLCRGWPQEVEQIVLNLLTNARQAVEARQEREAAGWQGWVAVRAASQKGQVMVRVEDNGGGIPEEVMPRIFEPFFTTKEPGEGTGLGLSLSRRLAEKQKGSLLVDNQPGEGAAFSLYLPVYHSAERGVGHGGD